MRLHRFSWKLAAAPLGAVLVMFGLACGGAEQAPVVQTVVVEKQVERLVVQTVLVEKAVEKQVVQTVVVEKPVERQLVQTVVVVATPTAAPLTTPTPVVPLARPVPNSILKVGVKDVGAAAFLAPKAVNPDDNRNHEISVFETLAFQDGKTGALVNRQMKSWKLEGLVFTAELDPRIQFHFGWGPGTAKDLAYSWTRQAEEGAVNSGAATLRNDWASWEAVSDTTFKATLKAQNVNWFRAIILSTVMMSERAIKEKGDAWAIQNAIGTGPYRLVGIVANENITLEAVRNHYRDTGYFETIRLLAAPEPQTRIAMLRTGEIDMMSVGIPLIPQVNAIKGVRLVQQPSTGRGGVSIFYGGQFYIREQKEGLKRTLDTTLPWVGDPNDPKSAERALKVRQALTMAVDKKLIVDTILGGKGCYGNIYQVDTCHPKWSKAYEVSYDPKHAKELLVEAGYPNGFSFPVWNPTQNDTQVEVSDAVLPFWEAIGLKPVAQKTAYTARRPLLLARDLREVWFMTHGSGILPFGGVFQWAELNGRGVWNQQIEYPDIGPIADRMFAAVGDEATQWKVQTEYWDWHKKYQPTGGGVYWNDPWALGGRVGSWDVIYTNISGAAWPVQLERVIPAH